MEGKGGFKNSDGNYKMGDWFNKTDNEAVQLKTVFEGVNDKSVENSLKNALDQTVSEKVVGFNPVTDIRIFGSNNPLINSNADDILPFLNTALSQTMGRKDLWLALKEVRISNAASRAPNSSGPFRFKIVEDGSTLKAIKLN